MQERLDKVGDRIRSATNVCLIVFIAFGWSLSQRSVSLDSILGDLEEYIGDVVDFEVPEENPIRDEKWFDEEDSYYGAKSLAELETVIPVLRDRAIELRLASEEECKEIGREWGAFECKAPETSNPLARAQVRLWDIEKLYASLGLAPNEDFRVVEATAKTLSLPGTPYVVTTDAIGVWFYLAVIAIFTVIGSHLVVFRRLCARTKDVWTAWYPTNPGIAGFGIWILFCTTPVVLLFCDALIQGIHETQYWDSLRCWTLREALKETLNHSSIWLAIFTLPASIWLIREVGKTRANLNREDSLPGISRFGLLLCFSALVGFGLIVRQYGSAQLSPGMMFIASAILIVPIYLRIKAIGYSPWIAVGSVVPIAGTLILVASLSLPANFQSTKRMDRAGWIIGAIGTTIFVLGSWTWIESLIKEPEDRPNVTMNQDSCKTEVSQDSDLNASSKDS
ncbi:MAG: hypothetical protein AAGI27_04400 [Pseudomonadota bacterium]